MLFVGQPAVLEEGSYEIGYVCASIPLSRNFLIIGSLVFSEAWYGVRDPYMVVRNS